jgi:hypothetical protein
MNQFVKDVTAFVDALGYDQPAIIISLAKIPWESETDRDQFIGFLTQEVPSG